MAKIKIEDLPKEMKISKEEMRNVLGGANLNVPTVVTMGIPIPTPYTGTSSGSSTVKVLLNTSGPMTSSRARSAGDEAGAGVGTGIISR